MDPDLLPTLVSYYQQSQRAKELAYKHDVRRQMHDSQRLSAQCEKAVAENSELSAQIEELKINLLKTQTIVDVRQREIESLRLRHQDVDKADKAQAQSLKLQADSYKQELSELRQDIQMRDEELRDLRQDATEREDDLKQARELARTRDRELKESRDQLRARESEVRKANTSIQKLQGSIQRLEHEVSESRDALEAAQAALVEAEDRFDAVQAQMQILNEKDRAVPKPGTKKSRPLASELSAKPQVALTEMASEGNLAKNNIEVANPGVESPSLVNKRVAVIIQSSEEPETDYNEPPSAKPAKKAAASKAVVKKAAAPKKLLKVSTANKENQDVNRKVAKKRKAVEEFSISPPRSSPPPDSPPRKKTKKPDFSMTPFVDRSSNKSGLAAISLSPPPMKDVSHKSIASDLQLKATEPKQKKKRKLLGGTKTLMDDDTPKKAPKVSLKTNFGKDLSPLKRPVSSAGLIIRD